MVIPNDGAGYELEASGLMAAAKISRTPGVF